MELRTLTLRNYRVFENLELEVPAGLVGIYGPNGSGKSTLLEAMTWALYGRARTPKQGIATSGSVGECVVELGFFHDEHHYSIRRTISGINHTVKARVTTAGQTVADGPTEVGRYVRSLLGMGEQAFRSSVFAEQKQLAAFSDNTADQRRRLVLSLLGITPIEKARDDARTDARAAENDYKRLATALPDVDELVARRTEIDKVVERHQRDVAAARIHVDTAIAERRRVAELRDSSEHARQRDALIREQGSAVRRDLDRAAKRIEALGAEEAEIAHATDQVEQLRAATSGHDAESAGRRLAAAVALLTALRRLAALAPLPGAGALSGPPSNSIVMQHTEARSASSALVAIGTEAEAGARRDVEAAERRITAAGSLTDDSPCPTCGQEVGGGVAGVLAHFTAERDEAARRHALAARELDVARRADRAVEKELAAAKATLAAAEAAWEQQRGASAARAAASDVVEEALAEYREANGGPAAVDEAAVAATIAELRMAERSAMLARQELDRLVGRRERLPALAREREEAARERAEAQQRRTVLLGQLADVGFVSAEHDALVRQAALAEQASDAALDRARQAEAGQGGALREQAELVGRIEQAEEQRLRLRGLADRAVLLGRTGELLNGFRQAVVATVGPRLSAQASELFLALTGGDYDGLTIDPDTYEINVIDQGVPYSTARFSGSEVDLANLALRVAISEQIRFQAGGQVGLLVLDEALASLDGDRRDRMLTALTQLSARFRQILVVTHAVEVKEQLPQAIEVLKLGPRRSTARLVGSQY
jgi:DNA repair protein SbcC/Rad50